MPVVDVKTDLDALTLTIVADFAAPVQRVWGPPEFPATFVDHDLRPGGRMNYYMSGPAGEKYCGYWRIAEVSEPDSFTFADGFADTDFNPNPDLPESQNAYSFTAHGNGTRATFVATYATAEGLQTVLDMGMIEGATSAMNQIDDLLAA